MAKTPHSFVNPGGIEMKEDKRDFVLGAAPVDMPEEFMQEKAWQLPILYQKDQPACGAHAGAWLKMLLDEYESPGDRKSVV